MNRPWSRSFHGRLSLLLMPWSRSSGLMTRTCAVVIEHGGLNAHPQVALARDALMLAQKRDILGRPPAYPINSADASP